jgi:hypothetical protein
MISEWGLPHPAMERPGFGRVIRFPGAFLSNRFAAKLDAKSIGNQPVENAVADGGIADLLMPVICQNVRRN